MELRNQQEMQVNISDSSSSGLTIPYQELSFLEKSLSFSGTHFCPGVGDYSHPFFLSPNHVLLCPK